MNRYLVILSLFAFFSCTVEEPAPPKPVDEGDGGRIVFDMSPLSRAQIEDSRVYMFDGTSSGPSPFVYRVPEFEYAGQTMSMEARVGTWAIVLVNAGQLDLAKLIPPTSGSGTMADQPMWELEENNEGIAMPELRTAHIDGQPVTEAGPNQASASLVRNVALVKVVVDEVHGMSTSPAAEHIVTLGGVPTTLSWEGKLLPDSDDPYTGRMSGTVSISDDLVKGVQVSDTLEFMIPAHKGLDWPSTDPTDTTTQNLTLSIDFQGDGGPSDRLVKGDVQVPITPKMNQILVLKLTVGSQMEVDAEIVEWLDSYTYMDLSQTELQVSRTHVAMSYRDTVYVKSSEPFTVTPGANWITTKKLPDGERLEITTSDVGFDYEAGIRSSYVTVTANNVNKRIYITQRPGTGTIFIDPDHIILSAISNYGSLFVWSYITPASAGSGANHSPWTIINAAPIEKIVLSKTGENASSNVNFSRPIPSSPGDLSSYGDEEIVFRNRRTLETKTLTVSNLHVEAPDKIVSSGRAGTYYNDEITAYGASWEYEFEFKTSDPNWLDVTIEGDGQLKFEVLESSEQKRSVQILVWHKDERLINSSTFRNSAKTVTLEFDPFFDIIEPFDFLIGRFGWEESYADMDIAVLVYDDGDEVTHAGKKSLFPENEWMGFTGGYDPLNQFGTKPIKFRDIVIARYGGDPYIYARDDAMSESFALYMNAIDDFNLFPEEMLTRYINVYMYAWWYNLSPGHAAEVTLQYSRGGFIQEDSAVGPSSVGTYAYVFSNPDGEEVYATNRDIAPLNKLDMDFDNILGAKYNLSTIMSGGATRVAWIRYDRLTHKAEVRWYSAADASNWPTTNVPLHAPLRAPLISEEQRQAMQALIDAKLARGRQREEELLSRP